MADQAAGLGSERLTSLDVFRGITMAAMILVNNPGTWNAVYGPLRHAEWNGWTPTDLVFPAFLFIVGTAMTFSFDRRLAAGASRLGLFVHVLRRAAVLILFGLILNGFMAGGSPHLRLVAPLVLASVGLLLLPEKSIPSSNVGARRWAGITIVMGAAAWCVLDFGAVLADALGPPAVRVPGVLQRIALCYLFCSLIVMFAGVRGRVLWTVGLLVGYWLIVRYVSPPADFVSNVPADRPEARLHDWIDVCVLGPFLYSGRPDPEGLLSTMPAMATTLIGILAGNWLRSSREGLTKTVGLFAAANVLLVAGLWMDHAFPINKKIWTSSYVLAMGGLSLHPLAMCYWLVDLKRSRWWTGPFLVFGMNAILVYMASGMVARLLINIKVYPAGGAETTVRGWMYQHFQSGAFALHASPELASLLFAIAYVLFWLVVMTPFYRRRVFLKV